jgi:DNA-binding MarR family transcriptional regulator
MTDQRFDALSALVDETILLFHRFRAAAETIHGEGESTAARRGVLRGLMKGGPQTVPQMARARPVSRQHIQTLVNALLEDGLVALEPNPAHRSSPIVALTSEGKSRLVEIEKRERRAFASVAASIDPRELRAAARTLAAVREAVAAEVAS